MGAPFYATREAVASALDIRDSARRNDQIDRALDAASRTAESICKRVFWPRVRTRQFEHDYLTPGHRLWLDAADAELADRPTSVLVGTTALTVADLVLYPADGPPYDQLETLTSSGESFNSSTSTGQLAVSVTGPFGYWLETAPAGTLSAAVADAATTSIVVSDPTAIGVGDLVEVNAERMIVTGRTWVDSTVDTTGALTASPADETLTVGDLSPFVEGETILVDAERMRITDISSTALIVDRAVDGSTLAAHSSGASVERSTSLAVERGAGFTTATTHLSGATVARWRPPAELVTFTLAEAVNTVQQERSGMARIAGGPDGAVELTGAGIKDRRGRLKHELGRRRINSW